MSFDSTEESILALAGVALSAILTKELAVTGSCPENELQLCVDSVLRLDAASTEEIFGEFTKLQRGLAQLATQLSLNTAQKDEDIARYIMNLLALERQLMRNEDMLAILSARLKQARSQAILSGDTGAQLLNIIADIYVNTIARLNPRVRVSGSPQFLEQKQVQDKVRTVLLFGIRCAVLWRQLGGKRRHLIFRRRKLMECATNLGRQLQRSAPSL